MVTSVAVKCTKHLHFGSGHSYGSFYLNGTVIASVISHKDLGIVFDNNLKFHGHTIEVTAKANCLMGNLLNIWSQICW